MADPATVVVGTFALIGVWVVLSHLGFHFIYSVSFALAAAVGGVVLYKLAKGESLDATASQVKAKAREVKGQAKATLNQR